MDDGLMKDVLDQLKEVDSENSFFSEKVQAFFLNRADYSAKHTKFSRTEFNGAIQFKDVNFSHGIFFDDSTFHGEVIFLNILVDKYDNRLHSNSESIVFDNCVFKERVYFRSSQMERALVFKDCTFEKGLDIYQLTIVTESLKIGNCTVKEKLDIFQSFAKQGVSFSNNSIESYVRLNDVRGSIMSFTQNNIIKGNLHVNSCQLEHGIAFNDGLFQDEIFFSLNQTRSSGLTIFGSTFEKAFTINYQARDIQPPRGISSFYISDATFQNGIYINGANNTFAANSIVDTVTLKVSAKLSGDIVFSKIDIGIFILTGYNSSANIILRELTINQVKIDTFINNAGFILSQVKASRNEWVEPENNKLLRLNAFYVNNSNLGKAQLYQVNFDRFLPVLFHNTILSDISTSLVEWFSTAQVDEGQNGNSFEMLKEVRKSKDRNRISNARISLSATLKAHRELYRQLKFVSQKQGDNPQALEFQQVEMNYYRKIVNLESPRNWSEYLILLSSLSNNFGQSWVKAFVLLLLFSFLSYVPIGWLTSDALDYTQWAASWADFGFNLKVIFWDNLKTYLIILNPTHRINEINENIDRYSSWVYFWDLLSRIVLAYFYFQVVSAFRKFNK
jgi:hypothetical protein